MAQLQHTSPTLGDTIMANNGQIRTDGVINSNAVMSVVDGVIRLDINGNGIIDANPIPDLGQIKVTREEGWQGNLGYRVVLEDWAEDVTPNAIALAIYQNPDGQDYHYTTGGMLWDDVKEEWYTVCPPGFEPGQNDIHMGFLYGATRVAAFTMIAEWDEQIFGGGGDWV
jgi:hypothetical protein